MSNDHLDDFPKRIEPRSTEKLLQLCGGERAVIAVSVRLLLGILKGLGPASRNRFIEQLEEVVEIQGTGRPVHVYRPFTTRDGSNACRYCHGRSDSPAHVPEPKSVAVGGVWYPRPESGKLTQTIGVAGEDRKVTVSYYATGNVVYRQDGGYAEVYEAYRYTDGEEPEEISYDDPEDFEDKVARLDALGTRLYVDGNDEERIEAFTMLRDKFDEYLRVLKAEQ
jgi:hypothetical protein